MLEYSPVPAREFMQPVLETTVDDLRANLEFSVLGPVAAVTAVIDPMLERGSGTLLFTTGGAAINPNPLRAGVGVSFAAEVVYARMLHDDLRDRGVHVGHTAVGGSIAPDGDHHPDEVADVLWGHHPAAPTSRSGSASTRRLQSRATPGPRRKPSESGRMPCRYGAGKYGTCLSALSPKAGEAGPRSSA